MRRSTACIAKKKPRARAGHSLIERDLSRRALDRDYSASIGGEAGDQLRALLAVGAEFRRNGLAHADRFDPATIGAFADQVGLDAVGAPLRELLVVLLAADAIGMPLDHDGFHAGAVGELSDHVAIQTRFRRLGDRVSIEWECLVLLES